MFVVKDVGRGCAVPLHERVRQDAAIEDVQRDAPARSQDHGGARRKADYIALTKAARARSDTLAPESIDLQRVTIFSAGLAVGAKESDAGKAFIACLTAPEAAPMITKSGLEPVTTR